MIRLRLALVAFLVMLSWAVTAAENPVNGLPDDTVWYLHANLEEMRNSESGSRIYRWVEEEVVVDINERLGIDLSSEVNSVTAFSDSTNGTVMIVDGPMTKKSQASMLALVQEETSVEKRNYKGMEYYFIGEGPEKRSHGDDPFDDLENASYSSFAIDGKAIIAASEAQLKALLDSRGKVTGSGSHDGALFVISADKSFVTAGLRTDSLSERGGDDWESNILRNTRQAALLVSDSKGMIAVEARLESTDPMMASAIGGIVNGLISLQAFNTDLGPEIQALIRSTKVVVKDAILSITAVVDPDLVVSALKD
jgi:hypothetical protein